LYGLAEKYKKMDSSKADHLRNALSSENGSGEQ